MFPFLPSCPTQESPEKTEKGKEGGGSRRGRDVGEEEIGGGRRGKEDAEPPPQATTAIAWITDKYFGTPLQVAKVDVGFQNLSSIVCFLLPISCCGFS